VGVAENFLLLAKSVFLVGSSVGTRIFVRHAQWVRTVWKRRQFGQDTRGGTVAWIAGPPYARARIARRGRSIAAGILTTPGVAYYSPRARLLRGAS